MNGIVIPSKTTSPSSNMFVAMDIIPEKTC